MKTVTAHQGQSILDIAIQLCGSVDAAYDIAVLNGIAVTDELSSGAQLVIPAQRGGAIVERYAVAGVNSATAIREEQDFDRLFFNELSEEFD